MKLKLLGLAALAVAACLAVPAAAEDKPAARKVMLRQKYEAGWTITDKSKEVRDTTITFDIGGQKADLVRQDTEEMEKATDVTGVENGEVTACTMTWLKAKTTHSQQKPGETEMSKPEEKPGDLD